MSSEFAFGPRNIGLNHPVYIIAEVGVNHNGDAAVAMAMVDAAAKCGVDAVKFQAFSAPRLVSDLADKAAHQKAGSNGEESQRDLLARLELPRDAYPKLMERCRQLGVGFLCTPFDESMADFLEALGVEGFKVGSGEVTNIPFLEHLAAKKKPIILSTGMSTLAEVDKALSALTPAPVALLHCLSSYPGDPTEANLKAIGVMASCFGVPVGFSDHTDTTWVAAAAVAAGAVILEKHFTLDRMSPGPDHKASLDPAGLAEMVTVARQAQAAMGDGIKRVMPGEAGVRAVGRRSLAAARDISKGETISRDMLWSLRPATGISPEHLGLVEGRSTTRDIPARRLLSWEDLA